MAIQEGKWIGKSRIETSNTDINCLNAVRTLHQTVIGLRTALDRSRNEINYLKSKKPTENIISKYSDAIEKLSLENHILRRKYLSTKGGKLRADQPKRNAGYPIRNSSVNSMADTNEDKPQEENSRDDDASAGNDKEIVIVTPERNVDVGVDVEIRRQDFSGNIKTDSDESEEVDDIELIFTTEDTKNINFHEELEPISDGDEEQRTYDNNRVRSTQSVLVETDISKCGIVYDVDDSALKSSVINSRLLSHQSAVIKDGKELGRKIVTDTSLVADKGIRPILNEKILAVRDSEAQTDISALPPCWKSESYLVSNKGSTAFTTLPSKFSIPPAKDNLLRKCSLKLCNKTKEARRILLSDINFTSMVPELSRSVDHLCHNVINNPVSSTNVNNNLLNSTLKYVKSPLNLTCDSSQSKFDFLNDNSSWDCRENSFSSSQYPSSVQDLNNCRRKQLSRPSIYSLDAYYCSNNTSSVPPSPIQRRHSSGISFSPTNLRENNFLFPLPGQSKLTTSAINTCVTSHYKQRPKVSFKEPHCAICTQQSLPNVAINLNNDEDSTDSLISESEECIRKSIDSTMTGYDNNTPVWTHAKYHRTFSEPDLMREFCPPLSARPFVARSPHELLVNYFVKVINNDGKVVGGKIQYVGIPSGKSEYYVGIVLATKTGESDGTFQGQKYFTCEKYFGLFVPFRKVIMAWKI